MRPLRSTLNLLGLISGMLAVPTNSDDHAERSLEKRGDRTSAPAGCLSVGSGSTYSTIASAIKALGSSKNDACIFIKSGTYEEQLTIDYTGYLILYGETTNISSYKSNKVLITLGVSSPAAGSLDASSTIDVRVPNFKMYNFNLENSFGNGAQVVAVTANADKLVSSNWTVRWRLPTTLLIGKARPSCSILGTYRASHSLGLVSSMATVAML